MSNKKIKPKRTLLKRKSKQKDLVKSAVPLKDLKKLSFNTPNILMGNRSETQKRILIFTPTLGLVRIEWVQARYGQIIPTNWSYVDLQQHLSPWITVDYQLADAQNLMAKEVVEGDYEWIIYCFVGDTLIETKDGGMKIKDIKEGMMVKTHTGEFKKVLSTMKTPKKQRSPMRWIKTEHSVLKATPEHPFYIRRGEEKMFVEAKDVTTEDLLLYPITNDNKKDILDFNLTYNTTGTGYNNLVGGSRDTEYLGEVEVTEPLAYLFGLFLADGHIKDDGIAITFDDHETEEMENISEIMKNTFGRDVSIGGTEWSTQVRLTIRNLGVRFEEWFGRGASNKRVPEFVFSWNYKNRASFLKGYIDGDGCDQGGGQTFVTVSEEIAKGISDLSKSLGLDVSEIKEREPITSVVKSGANIGREIIGKHTVYTARIKKYSWNKVLDIIENPIIENYVEIPLIANEKHYWASSLVDNYVYNFEVEGDNSYVAGPCAVHNCESDNVIPPDAFLRLNQYMNEQDIPVVSGLYFLKSDITEPLIYRGRGTSHFKDWKLGDLVWCDGIPFGLRLEHAGLIKAAWKESREIVINGIKTREVFSHPTSIWQDPDTGGLVALGGTTDLEWCRRLIQDKLLEKAGFPEIQKKKNPFLVDTRLFVKHIDQNGQMWPKSIPARFVPDNPDKYKGKEIH